MSMHIRQQVQIQLSLPHCALAQAPDWGPLVSRLLALCGLIHCTFASNVCRWQEDGAKRAELIVCLHCGVVQHQPDGPDEGNWECPISYTQQHFKRLKPHMTVLCTSMGDISAALGQTIKFLALAHFDMSEPRNCSRAAVLALG